MSKFREPFVPDGSPLLYKSWANYPMYNFSYSLASDIASCGQKTIYSRFQGITTLLERASFKFGICCEESVVEYLRIGGDPETGFSSRWMQYKNVSLEYTSRDGSWSSLFEVGKALMRLFVRLRDKEPFSKIFHEVEFGAVLPYDQYQTWYNGTRLEYIADFIGHPPGEEPILFDMKTAGQTFAANETTSGYPALDPQLQTGALASRLGGRQGFRRVGFIALVKTKSPNIEFVEGYVTDQMLESRDAWLKEQYHKLVDRRLFMNSGVRWPDDKCKMCDYLPKCLGNEALAEKTLRVKGKEADGKLQALDE